MKKLFFSPILVGFFIVFTPMVVWAVQETVSYVYDDLGRVVQVSYGGGEVINYGYDAAGNRTTLTISGTGNAPPPSPVVNPDGTVVVLPFDGFVVVNLGDAS